MQPAPSSTPAGADSQITGLGGAQPAPANDQQPSATVTNLDDWRKALSGGDEKLLAAVSQFKSPEDVGKELLRQKQELSKRAASGAFPEKGTPEAQAEWRKANNVPDKGTLEAYGVKPPDGYAMSKVETAALSEYTELMQKNNVPASIVQSTVDTFFRAQAANQQMANELNEQTNKSWRSEFDKQHGRDAQPYLAAANAMFEQAIPDEATRNTLLNATLPGGGSLATNPAFLNMMVDFALKNGFGDRIEANDMESGGKSLAMQQAELEALRRTDRARYNDSRTQDQLKRIITLRQNRGEIDEFGNERQQRR